MCGIIAAFSKSMEVNDFIIDQYENQYSRGEEGFGIIRIDGKKNVELDRACEPTKFMMDLYVKRSKMIIAHHRYPTSTDNQLDQTHPMALSNELLDYDYLIIHNGVVSNDDELREKHLKLGFKYTTEYQEQFGYDTIRTKFNDSEAIAIEMALFIEGKSKAIETENSAALIALQINKKTKKATTVFFGRSALGALNMFRTEGDIRISSEGAGEKIKENELFSFDVKDLKIQSSPMIFEVPKKVIVVPPKEEKKEIPVVQDPREKKEDFVNNINTKESFGRNWNTNDKDDSAERTIDSLPPYAGKGYIETSCTEFKERIKEDSSSEITHTIDDALDEELDKVTELITDYKNTLLQERLSNDDLSFYSSQIFRITKTMKMLADIADADYKEKQLLEDQEIADYNLGWPDIPESRKEEEKAAMMKAYEDDIMGYREY